MDLHSPEPFWLIKNGLMHDEWPPLGDERCDVLIVGGGITGALVADRLSAEGRDVVVVDRRATGSGSTSASTALLIYDIDEPLHRLVDKVGVDHAVRAYRMGIEAIEQIEELCVELKQEVGDDCGFRRRQSLWVAKPDEAEQVDCEVDIRLEHGFAVERLDGQALNAAYGIHRPCAMRGAVAAQVDPFRLAHRLLERVRSRGGRIYNHAAVDSNSVRTQGPTQTLLDTGQFVHAQHVVVAAGYEGSQWLDEKLVDLFSTFAFVSQRLRDFGHWKDKCLIWETGDPYLYLRSTEDDRVIVGGEDIDFKNAPLREGLLEKKIDTILQKMSGMMPWLELEPRYAWAGTFGSTKDGLPYIGQHPSYADTYFALGYGGNGITFSTMASQLIADAIAGRDTPDAAIYRFGR